MRKTTILIIAFLLSVAAFAQAPPELPGYSVTVNVGFSTVTGNTGNGMFASVAVPLKTFNAGKTLGTVALSARADNFAVLDPSVNIILGGPEFRFQFSKPTLFNGAMFQPFVNAGAGVARFACAAQGNCATGVSTTSHVAEKFGGGLDMVLTSNMTARLFEVDYIRSSILPNGHININNAVQVTAGIGFHF